MSQLNLVDKSAHRSDLGLTLLSPIFVLVTLPAALGADLILVALVFYSQSDDFPKTSQINPVSKSAHRSDLGLSFFTSDVCVGNPTCSPRFTSDLDSS